MHLNGIMAVMAIICVTVVLGSLTRLGPYARDHYVAGDAVGGQVGAETVEAAALDDDVGPPIMSLQTMAGGPMVERWSPGAFNPQNLSFKDRDGFRRFIDWRKR